MKIPEPSPEKQVVEPDVLLVPLLAFSEDCHRLGYGGGFYDRTIARLKAKKTVITIGVAFEVQKYKI